MIDRKYKILAVNPCSGNVHTEEDSVLFLAKDQALLVALEAYVEECSLLGCEDTHIEGVNLLIERVEEYQRKVKVEVPDTNTPCEIERCIKGIIKPENESNIFGRVFPCGCRIDPGGESGHVCKEHLGGGFPPYK